MVVRNFHLDGQSPQGPARKVEVQPHVLRKCFDFSCLGDFIINNSLMDWASTGSKIATVSLRTGIPSAKSGILNVLQRSLRLRTLHGGLMAVACLSCLEIA